MRDKLFCLLRHGWYTLKAPRSLWAELILSFLPVVMIEMFKFAFRWMGWPAWWLPTFILGGLCWWINHRRCDALMLLALWTTLLYHMLLFSQVLTTWWAFWQLHASSWTDLWHVGFASQGSKLLWALGLPILVMAWSIYTLWRQRHVMYRRWLMRDMKHRYLKPVSKKSHKSHQVLQGFWLGRLPLWFESQNLHKTTHHHLGQDYYLNTQEVQVTASDVPWQILVHENMKRHINI